MEPYERKSLVLCAFQSLGPPPPNSLCVLQNDFDMSFPLLSTLQPPAKTLVSAFLCPCSNLFLPSDEAPSHFWNFSSETKIIVTSLAESSCLHEEADGSCAEPCGIIIKMCCLICKLKGFFLGAARSHCGLNIFLSKCPCEWAMNKEQDNWFLISPVGWL